MECSGVTLGNTGTGRSCGLFFCNTRCIHTGCFCFFSQFVGKHRKAVKDLSQAIALDINVGENYYHRGESLLRLGMLEEALEEFQEAIRKCVLR